jgi:hypothetical protein
MKEVLLVGGTFSFCENYAKPRENGGKFLFFAPFGAIKRNCKAPLAMLY